MRKELNTKCKLLVWDSAANENILIDGVITGEIDGYYDEDFMRYDVETIDGIYYGCHPDCVKVS